jgi:NAD+ kinase
LDIKNIEYEQVDLDKKDDNININPDSIILGLGGDGTALRAMKLGWINKVPVLNIGSGRIGYLVNSLEDVDFEAISSKSNKKYIQSRTPIIQDKNIKSPAFNEIVIIKNSPTRLLDLEIDTYEQKVKLRADGIIISTSLGSTAYNYTYFDIYKISKIYSFRQKK